MKIAILAAIAGATLAVSPAWANHHEEGEDHTAPKAEVIERDANGRATRIKVDGQEYAVCRDGQQDSCINPREAGLDFGGVPIDYWPGRPASEIDGPLPAEAPASEAPAKTE